MASSALVHGDFAFERSGSPNAKKQGARSGGAFHFAFGTRELDHHRNETQNETRNGRRNGTIGRNGRTSKRNETARQRNAERAEMEVTGLLSTGTASDPYLGGSSSANLDERTAAKRRGAAWDGWEDRALTKQVLADDPILSKACGRRED
ncbi:uncharacterized protein H6S33_003768 [Morchella sextelata]|uniref:uncharacterized protein n=1 Tax=Morchella sextelata TaxID=1174677 RepID=UPI001D0403AA|nr:uncharacterized protein H6S33_003768 [Morchella sextelata]KAH0606107.1 hypothetical protein H6S33_003768 [Morchella sextelata]